MLVRHERQLWISAVLGAAPFDAYRALRENYALLTRAIPMLEAVDIPTSDVLDPKTFSTSFRFSVVDPVTLAS